MKTFPIKDAGRMARALTAEQRLAKIAEIIEVVGNRAMVADRPVTTTLDEMTQHEMTAIYLLAKG